MIKSILYRALALVGRATHLVRYFFKNLGPKRGVFLGVGVLVVVLGSLFILNNRSPEALPGNAPVLVTLASVRDLSSGGSSLSVGGIITSQTEATVRAQKSGEVTRVYYSLGDYVSAGAVVAELENSAERAAVLQAQGVLNAAKAGAEVSQSSLLSTKDSSVATLLSSYGTIEKIIHTDIDEMFSNPHGAQPQFNVQSSNTQAKIDVQNTRVILSTLLERESDRSASLTPSDDLVSEMLTTESELKKVREYLDSVIVVLSGGIASSNISDSTIATYKTTATTARGTITTALTTLITARQTLQSALTNYQQGSGIISSTQATLTQAEGSLAAARSTLEKSLVRAPISGTINSLELTRGDYVQVLSPVLTIANNRALEAVCYITAEDTARVAVGDKALLEGAEGIVTRVAPALDPLTKKIEVRVGLSATAAETLINGQSVVITFSKTPRAGRPAAGPLTVPLTALKIGSREIVVFTVGTSSTPGRGPLVPHPVVLGNLLGDRAEVTKGLEADMVIVVDARGLQAGESVEIKN